MPSYAQKNGSQVENTLTICLFFNNLRVVVVENEKLYLWIKLWKTQQRFCVQELTIFEEFRNWQFLVEKKNFCPKNNFFKNDLSRKTNVFSLVSGQFLNGSSELRWVYCGIFIKLRHNLGKQFGQFVTGNQSAIDHRSNILKILRMRTF